MKNIILLYLCTVFLLNSCKKETLSTPNSSEAEIDSLQFKGVDYVSLEFNGKKYICDSAVEMGVRNEESNKRDSIGIDGSHYWIGDKDSIMFSRNYRISSQDRKVYLTLSIFKKYSKKDCIYSTFYLPKNVLDLFNVGEHQFSVDFGKQSSNNGVSIEFQVGNQFYSTRNEQNYWGVPDFKQEIQNNSSFKNLTLGKNLKSGFHYIEGNFNCQIIDKEGILTPLEAKFFRIGI